MRGFLADLYVRRIKPGLDKSREALTDLAELPERCRTLEQECERLQAEMAGREAAAAEARNAAEQLKSQVAGLEGNLRHHADETASLRGEVARTTELACHLEAMLEHEAERAERATRDEAYARDLLAKREAELEHERLRAQDTVQSLTARLEETAKAAALLQTLHDETVARLTTTEEGLTEKARAAGAASEKVDELERRYRVLMGEVRKSTRDLVERLVDRGLPAAAVAEIVPDVAGLFPRPKLLELEEEIRRHNAEQEALLGLKKLAAPPPHRISQVEVPSPPLERERTFFQRIFDE